MTTPSHFRRTTADPRSQKLLRVKGALLTPELAAKSNRAIAREIQVDEATVRKWRKWADQFVPQPGYSAPAIHSPVPKDKPPPQRKKDTGKKRAGKPKR